MSECLNPSCNNTTKNPKYCSRSCAAQHINVIFPKRKTKKKCTKCGDPVKSYRHTLCINHWNEYQSNRGLAARSVTLKELWNKSSVKGKHLSWKNVMVRNFANTDFKHLKELPCACCGYDLHVELAHRRPVSDFPETATILEVNHKDNVVQLCRNCHWEFDNLEDRDIFSLSKKE